MEEKNDKKLGIQELRPEVATPYFFDLLLGNDLAHLPSVKGCKVEFTISTSTRQFSVTLPVHSCIKTNFTSDSNIVVISIKPEDGNLDKNRKIKFSSMVTECSCGYTIPSPSSPPSEVNWTVILDATKIQKAGIAQTPVTVTDKQG